jgi:hypothetical protein
MINLKCPLDLIPDDNTTTNFMSYVVFLSFYMFSNKDHVFSNKLDLPCKPLCECMTKCNKTLTSCGNSR